MRRLFIATFSAFGLPSAGAAINPAATTNAVANTGRTMRHQHVTIGTGMRQFSRRVIPSGTCGLTKSSRVIRSERWNDKTAAQADRYRGE